MDHKNHDQVFFVNFGKVLGALLVIFFICMAAAMMLDTGEGHADPASASARINERTQPLGVVVTDPNVLMQMQTASKPVRAAYTGDQVVTKVCGACHDSGVLGAPKTGDKATWSARKGAAGGFDGLVKNAVVGKNTMPPRGGDADLSDDEVKAAVEVMLKKSGA